MDEEAMTQLTQNVMDPRRIGRNNSGLCAADCSDVVCILHPCTPAAFRLVTETARRAPQHVLHLDHRNNALQESPSLLEEQETFILNENAPNQGLDLAVRFSSPTVQPHLGFVFGRNRDMCDVVVSTDAHKRVSNVHFTIFVNKSGVLMLRDMSTNGTMVDEILLKGKGTDTQTRMLNNGSIIQILSPNQEEILRFIVRIPNRDGFEDEYHARFHDYIARAAAAELKWREMHGKDIGAGQKPTAGRGAVKSTLIRNTYGMHWSGGEKYNVVGYIGKGAFANVYQLATKNDGQLFAAKELEKRRFMKNGILDRKLENEMLIMKQIDHPHIVQYVDYQDQHSHLYIIMEYIGCGDLQQYLATNGALPESMAKRMAAQVFDALDYLHRKRITHRDIKPDNLLLADLNPDTFSVKLSDFGLSKVVKDNDTFLKTFCGTLLYCAPEVFPHYDAHMSGKGTKRPRKTLPQQPAKAHIYSSAVDIWSFGAVLWYALCLRPPFEGVADATGRGMFDKIMTTALDVSDLMTAKVTREVIVLLGRMMNVDPAARPTPFECLHDGWFGREMPVMPDHLRPGLVAIAEESELALSRGDEPNFAALSLNEQPGVDERGELSINSADLNFFDPRESKRFKPSALSDDERDDMINSSPELLYQSIPIIRDDSGGLGEPIAATAPVAGRPPKLFGEISRSDLQKPMYELRPMNKIGPVASSSGSDETEDRLAIEQNAQPMQQAVAGASPSLLGAESMVRDMQVDSVHSPDSPNEQVAEPTTPGTPLNGKGDSLLLSITEITPKAAVPRFNRQIDIAIPPSFYFDPADPKTHTIEHAIRQSGHDYLNNPVKYMEKENSHPATSKASSSKSKLDDLRTSPSSVNITTPTITTTTTNTTIPNDQPPRYGRLISTPESFAQITLNLNTRISKWGRDKDNTHVYADPSDTRIAKTGIVLCFHANGIEAVDARGEDWTTMPGLHCEILTHASCGLFVNGVRLRKPAEANRQTFGRLHSGDRIVAWVPSGGKPGLEFVVELFVGEGRRGRTGKVEDAFRVEVDELVESESEVGEDGAVVKVRHWAPSRK